MNVSLKDRHRQIMKKKMKKMEKRNAGMG